MRQYPSSIAYHGLSTCLWPPLWPLLVACHWLSTCPLCCHSVSCWLLATGYQLVFVSPPPLCPLCCTMSSVPPMKTILISDYKDILLAHESQYHLSKGSDHQEVLEQIIEEITSQGKGKHRQDADAVKALTSVSLLPMESWDLTHLDLENSKLVYQPQDCLSGGWVNPGPCWQNLELLAGNPTHVQGWNFQAYGGDLP